MFKSEEIDLKHYWYMILRQKKVILVSVCTCVLLATILNLVTAPVYQATTRVEVSKEPTRSALTGEVISSEDWRSDNVALYTTAELISARSLLREVALTLRQQGILQAGVPQTGLFRGFGARNSSADGSRRPATAEGGEASAASMDQQIDWLQSILEVKPISETRLVSIQVEFGDPRVAREIADTIAQKFVQYQKYLRSKVDNERVDYLRAQASEVGQDVDAMEKSLYNSRQAGLPVLESRLKQLTETTGGLNDAYVKTKIEREAAGEKLARVQEALRDSTVSSNEVPIQSETLESLRRDLQQREAELAKAREVYKERHPKLIVLESELDAIRGSIRAELEKSVATLQDEYAGLVAREATLKSNIAQTDGQVRSLNDRLGQHAALENELASKRNLQTLLVGKVQEAEISSQVQQPLVKIVEPATVGLDPVRPRRGLNLLLGLLVGLMSGLGLALLLEYLRQCIRTPKDVVEQLHLPVLGMIPRRA